MKRFFALFAITASLGVATANAYSQTVVDQAPAGRERLKSMTPEERAAARDRAKAKWESMTPQEQEAARKRLAENRPRLAERLAKKQGSEAARPK